MGRRFARARRARPGPRGTPRGTRRPETTPSRRHRTEMYRGREDGRRRWDVGIGVRGTPRRSRAAIASGARHRLRGMLRALRRRVHRGRRGARGGLRRHTRHHARPDGHDRDRRGDSARDGDGTRGRRLRLRGVTTNRGVTNAGGVRGGDDRPRRARARVRPRALPRRRRHRTRRRRAPG